MALISYFTIASPATLDKDGKTVLRTKLNDNSSLWQSEMTAVEKRLELTADTLFGAGLTSTPTVTTSTSSLSVTVAAFTCQIGAYILYAGGTFTALANQTDATIYFCQDSTFSTTLPTTKSYMIFGTYTSTGVGVTSFTLATVIVIPQYTTLSGTFTDINVPDVAGYADYQIDHSTLGTIIVPGFITLTVSPSTDFTVGQIYTSEVQADAARAASHTVLMNLLPNTTTSWVRISRRSGYYYSDNPNCDLTYSRTGLVLHA